MPFMKGRDGVVKAGSPVAALGHVQNWNVDYQADEVRGWGMGDDFETAFTTIKRWNGSVEVYLDATDPSASIDVGDEIAVEFYPGGETAGLTYWSGTAAITGQPASGSKDGIPTMTINFSGRGALTKTTVS
ncbi:hypothetical protein [Tropicimonas sp. IMCC34043]|uniref:hypothetical protein n=1 Tax=Tropicimonas sp. IMCC34043 TaxID=2248760 RepID=UPI000E22BA16|nr:hypothetical protein [Tropicimonas sp. IMCC34043]